MICLWCDGRIEDGNGEPLCRNCLEQLDAPLPLTFDGCAGALQMILRRQLEHTETMLERVRRKTS